MRSLGIILIVISFPIYFLVPGTLALNADRTLQVSIAIALYALSQLTFWIGIAITGKDIPAQLKRRRYFHFGNKSKSSS